MNRSDIREAYYEASGKASDIVRQLCFAALAVVWIFRPESPPGTVDLPPSLSWAGILAVAGLAADLLQYVYRTIAWGTFHRVKELEGVADDVQFKAPRSINWPSYILFGAKLVAVTAAYFAIFVYLAGHVRSS